MRLFNGSALTRSLAACATLGLAILVAAPVAVRADSTDDDIKAMKDLEKAGKDDECVAKIDVVRAGADTRAFIALKELVTSKSDKIACAAIKGLAITWHDGEYFRWLLSKIDDKTLYARDGRPEVYKCVLDTVRVYPPEKVKAGLKQLGDAVNRFMSTEPEFADLAIRAYGTVPDRFTVMQLLDWLGQASAKPGPKDPKEAKENREKSKKSILETLAALCGKDFPDLAQWKKFWDENGKTFKFPEPPKAAAAGEAPAADMPDPSKLTEFKDDYYGFTVKKPDDVPEGTTWKFFKPDYKGPRVGLMCLNSEGINTGRAYFRVHDPSRFEPHGIKAFAEWVIGTEFREHLDTEGMPQQPDTKEMKFGGADWTVVTGKGLALGPLSNWGTIEHRYYLTKLDPYIFYIDVYVKMSADDEDKEALWKCIESIVMPPPKK